MKLWHYIEENYLGKKFKLSHLFIFECKIFTHITKEYKNKLEPKSCKGVLVGYDKVSKGYCCFILQKHKL